jgi:AraC-like DNA-binding protein
MSILIRSASLTNFEDIAHECGLDAMQLLTEAGLSVRCLKEVDLKVPVALVGRLLELAAQQAKEPAFGLRMVESRRLSNLGPLGLLLRDEPTLKEALHTLVRYIGVHNEAMLIRLEHAGHQVIIRVEMVLADALPKRQATELALGVTFKMISLFMGVQWRPRLVCLSHAAPASLQVHQRVFGDAVAFGQDFNGIVCDAIELNLPNPSADPVMARYAQRLLETSSTADASFEKKVRELVLLLLPLGQCNAKVVAQHLDCDRRTLSRRLSAIGKTFLLLVNDHRLALVRHCLAENSKSLAEVSALLGFASPSAFSRWYRQHFGQAARSHRLVSIE